MATNNFKPFATAANANVTAQADWETLPALLSGFTAGKASSAQVNKAIRQASFIAAALAQYTANKSGLDVLDDGDLNGFIAKMSAAFGKDFQALDATLTALAGLTTGANKLPYFNGNDTAALTDLTQVGRDIVGKSTISDILTYLGLGDVVHLANFTSGTGWRKTPDGYIEVWGQSAIANSTTGIATASFTIPFPSECLSVQINEVTNSSSGVSGVKSWGLCADTISKTGVSGILNVTGSPATGEFFLYKAIGR